MEVRTFITNAYLSSQFENVLLSQLFTAWMDFSSLAGVRKQSLWIIYVFYTVINRKIYLCRYILLNSRPIVNNKKHIRYIFLSTNGYAILTRLSG